MLLVDSGVHRGLHADLVNLLYSVNGMLVLIYRSLSIAAFKAVTSNIDIFIELAIELLKKTKIFYSFFKDNSIV